MTAASHEAGQVYVFHTSCAQRSLWFLDQLAPGSSLYNLHIGTRLRTTIDVSALERSINEIVRRHESLRTAFKVIDGEPMQVVAPRLQLRLPVTDLRHLPEAEREEEALRIANDQAQTQFDISKWPLLRASLLVLADEDNIFLLTMHHIVCDFWSLELFQEELSIFYEAFCSGRLSPLPELPIQYGDFAEWERKWLSGPASQSHMDYWKQQLTDIPVLRLPTDWPRPPVSSFAGAARDFEVPDSIHSSLVALARQERVTLFMVTLAAFQTLLHRYTGQDDVVVGTPVANRNQAGVQGLIGFFVNSLVLSTDLSGDPRFRDLLARVRKVALDAYAHQEVPFEKLVSELRPERGPGYNPLFQVHFQLFSDGGHQNRPRPLAGEPLLAEVSTAKFDLALDLWEYPDALWGHLEYSTDLFSEETSARLERHFIRLLESIAADPDQRLSELQLLDEDERHEILVEWNDTEIEYPGEKCLQQLFEAQVRQSPNTVALTFRQEHLTYGELNDRANQLAHHLRSLGTKSETIVAICAERSLEMIIGVLGILKAGAAYLPLNPSDPRERIRSILEDARPQILLVQHHLLETIPVVAPTSVCLDTAQGQFAHCDNKNPGVELSPRNLAYVIYTSGSSGKPKGVQIEHQAVCNHLLWMQSAFPLEASDRILHKYPFNFDASVCEIFSPLLAGARLILSEPSAHWDSARFVQLLDEHQVTVLDLVPSMLEVLLAEPSFPDCRSLRRVISGGEMLRPELRDRFFRQMQAELHNIYGPTEATIGASSWTCLPEHAHDIVPIGWPAGNMRVYILDSQLSPVPVGVRGELYIAGAGLARGYLNRADLTSERFIADPFSGQAGARMYKTGDVARYMPDGAIEYVCRVDDQVKLRGHRVEPGEIETVLSQHECVQACSVVAVEHQHHHKRLVAYVSPAPDPPELWPSLGEYDVYDDLLYYAMTHDECRNRSYRAAIDRVVKGKVVLDLGTGADALLARFCVQAGAARVYALEAGEDAFRHAKTLVERLDLTERITVVRGHSTEVELPEPVDVCVSEILGTIGSSEGAVPVLNDARRFLKNHGTMIPHRCVTKIAPVSLPEHLTGALRLTQLPSVYTRRVFDRVGHPFDLRLCIKNFPRENLLSQSQVFEALDFSGLVPPEDSCRVRFTIDTSSRLDGFLLWLNLYPAEGDEPLDSLNQRLSWLPVFFPVFHPGLEVSPGDVIEAECARAVAEDGRMPDYLLEGVIAKGDGSRISFSYRSAWRTPAFRACSFYDSLFTNMDGQLLGAGDETEFRGNDDGHSPGSDRWKEPAVGLTPKLRRFLQERLPEYMIPSSFVLVDQLPRLSSGKLDRSALIIRDQLARRPEGAYVAPVNEIEQVIADAWRDVLAVGQVGVHDNFFDLGGDSLLITQVLSRLKPALDREISVVDLFRYPTVSALAQHLRDRGEAQAATLKAAQDRARKQRNAVGRSWRQPR